MKTKSRKKWWIVAVVVLVVLIGAMGCGGSSDEPADQEAPAATEEQAAGQDEAAGHSLKYGELLDVNENDGVLVVKAKIEPSYNNKATIDQNYFNVDDLIQSQGCDKFDEIQYWAVADMTDGSEQKVISFTVDKALIDQIAGGNFPANTMGDYVTDLWIHQSLEQ